MAEELHIDFLGGFHFPPMSLKSQASCDDMLRVRRWMVIVTYRISFCCRQPVHYGVLLILAREHLPICFLQPDMVLVS